MLKPNSPLFRGFDDEFWAPHSRAMGIARGKIEATPELELLAYSDEAGVAIVKTTVKETYYETN